VSPTPATPGSRRKPPPDQKLPPIPPKGSSPNRTPGGRHGPSAPPATGSLRRALETVRAAGLPPRALLVGGLWVLAICPLLAAFGPSFPGTALPAWPLELGAGVGLLLSGILGEFNIGDRLWSGPRSTSGSAASDRRYRFAGGQFRRIGGRSRTITASRTSSSSPAAPPPARPLVVPSPDPGTRPTAGAASRPVPQFQAVARMLEDIDRLQSDLSGTSPGRRNAAGASIEPPKGRCAGCDLRFDDPSESRSACADCHGLLCGECASDALHDGRDGRCPTCWTLYETFDKKSRGDRWGPSLPSSPRGS
jgi:hypothetical protein